MKKVLLLLFISCWGVLLKAETVASAPRFGDGSLENPYQIANLANLRWLSENSGVWGKIFIQTADIDAAETSSWNSGFSPIGNDATKFQGTYNGNAWSITGLNINKSGSSYIGLFGYTTGATITGINLVNESIFGASYVGGLTGKAENTSVSFCKTSGIITADKYVSYVGGLIGQAVTNSNINKCSSAATVIGWFQVGGLLGRTDDGTVSNCFATGNVSNYQGGGQYCGGLIGLSSSTKIENSYALGDVSGNVSAGGLIGSFYNSSSIITNSYAKGMVSCNSSNCGGRWGGLVGECVFEPTIKDSYWNSTVNANPSDKNGTPLDASQMTQTTSFGGFSFYDATTNPTGVWDIQSTVNNGYPFLTWQGVKASVSTDMVATFNDNMARINARISSIGFYIPTESGVVWDTKPNPTIALSTRTMDGSKSTGSFTSSITDLQSNTMYHVRAYVTTASGTSYGNDIVFVTKEKAPSIRYSQKNLSFLIEKKITPITPSNNGGAPQQMNVSTFASVNNPGGMAFDKQNNLYVTNRKDQRIQKIAPNGKLGSLAYQTGQDTIYDNPSGIAIAADGTIYFADRMHHVIKKISTDGLVTVFAGSGTADFADGPGTSAKFNNPIGLKFDKDGDLIVAEFNASKIRKISPIGMVSSVNSSSLNTPVGLTFDSLGNVFVVCYYGGTIGKISSDGMVTTFAGSGKSSVTDGLGSQAGFAYPHDICTDKCGDMYVVDNDGHTVRKISAAGNVMTIAGKARDTAKTNGIGTAARFNHPTCVVLDSIENLYVGDGENNLIRKLTRYSISPALPAGLVFNTNTGEISGTPTEEKISTQYTITCANTAGSSTFDLNLATEAPRLSVATTNHALDFDGVNDYVEVKKDAALNPAKFTIEADFKWNGGNDYQSIITSRDGNNGLSGYIVYVNGTTKKLEFWIGPNIGAWQVCDSLPIEQGKWNHLAVEYDGTAMKMFLNGIVGKSLTCPYVPNSYAPLRIGAGVTEETTPKCYFKGLIDNVRIWDTCLTEAQIKANANHAIVKAPHLVASYLFDQGVPYGDNTAIDSLVDFSGNNKRGRITNLALYGATSNFVQGVDTVLHLAKEENSFDTLYISSNATWKATTTANWLTINPGSGTGDAKISVKATSVSEQPRTATIEVSIAGIIRKIAVTQEAGVLLLDTNKIALGQAQSTKDSITLTSNMAWKIESMPSWATASALSGTGTAKIIITASEANVTGIPRTENVIISVGKGLSKTFKLTQKAMPTITWVAPAAIIYGTALSGEQLSAKATSGSNTVVGNYVYSPDTDAVLNAGKHTLSVTFSPNETTQFEQATATVTLQVEPKQLSISSQTLTTEKVYDKQRNAEIKDVVLKDVVSGDESKLSVSALVNYQDSLAGENKTITVTYKLSGDAAKNYIAPKDSVVKTGRITPKALTISKVTTYDTIYNGTTAVRVSGGELLDVINGDKVSVQLGTAQFSNSIAAENKPVTLTGSTLTGAAKNNYSLIEPTELTATISKKQLTITAHDTTITQGDAIPPFSLTYKGFVEGETASSLGLNNIVTTTAQKGSKVGEYPIIFNKISLNNYSLDTIGGKLTINKRKIENTVTRRNCDTIQFDGETYTSDTAITKIINTAVGNDSTVTYHLLVSHASGDTVSYNAALDSAQKAFDGKKVGSKPTYYSSTDSVLLHNAIDSAIKTRNKPCYTAANLKKASDSLRTASKRFIASCIPVVDRTALNEAIKNLEDAIIDSANYSADLTAIKQILLTANEINKDSTSIAETIATITDAVNNATKALKITLSCTPKQIIVGGAAKDTLCVVSSNYKYSKSSDDWISFSNDTLHITKNTGTAIRTGKIVFTAKSLHDTITIVQDAPITAYPLADITIISDQPNKKFWFNKLFSYSLTNISYSVESSNIDIVTTDDFKGGFALVSGIDGTTTIKVSAKSAAGSEAHFSVKITVTSGVCITLDTLMTHPQCSGDSTGRIVVTPTNGTAPFFYSWSNFEGDSIVDHLPAGKYRLTVTDATGCNTVRLFNLKQGTQMLLTPHLSAPKCETNTGAISVSVTGGNEPYRYQWASNSSELNSISNVSAGLYLFGVTDKKGCKASLNIQLNDEGAPQIIVDSVKESPCGKSLGAIYTRILGNYDAIRWSNDSTEKQITRVPSQDFAITVTSGNCISSQTINVPHPAMKQPQLALVSIDSAFKKNLVVWLRDKDTSAISEYRIFRDGLPIVTVPYRYYSVYHDTAALVDPSSQPYTYQIMAINACKEQSPLSAGLTTLYLQANESKQVPGGVDLRWGIYKSGLTLNKYVIYRSNGHDAVRIDSVINKTMFTDKTPGKNPRYFVALALNDSIEVSQLKTDTGPFSQSLSNVSEASLVFVSETDTALLAVYPNPSSTSITVAMQDADGAVVSLVAANGVVLAQTTITDGKTELSVSTLPRGLYTVQVHTNKDSFTKTVIVE